MDPQTQRQPRSERRGPEIYVHLEFRVSWGKKQQTQPPKNHQITFRSRGPRERTPAFPRQVPPPNTNYLAAIHTFEHRQSMIRELRRSHVNNNNTNNYHANRHHQMQEYYYQGEPQPPHLQVPTIREPERPTRADARQPSHERGSSAPPPIGDNPWDVTALPQDHHHHHHQAARHSDLTPTRSMTEIKRKPLPARPSQFRLSEGGQPWFNWSLPDGYEPDDNTPDDDTTNPQQQQHNTNTSFYSDLSVSPQAPTTASPGGDRNSTTYATNPTMVSTFSPDSTNPSPVCTARDLETGRARELGNLSAAMMTVDNGFETQWWYQGSTRGGGGVDDDHLLPPPPLRAAAEQDDNMVDESPVVHHHHHHYGQQQQQHHQRWAVADGDGSVDGVVSEPPSPVVSGMGPALGRGMTGVVSPMTEAAFSPAPAVPVGLVVQRSLSTRSEELWFTERG